MLAWQIKGPEIIDQTSGKENLESIDNFKIKIKQTLLTKSDFDTFSGENKCKYPIIPGTIAVGEVVEIGDENNYYGIKKLNKVYLNPVLKEVQQYVDEEETAFLIAGKNANGFLKDFVVTDFNGIFLLPEGISLNQAIYIELISLCINTIDTLGIEKGEHVAIIGGNILGNIFAQVVNYYQGVPIIIDSEEEKLELAKKCGIYYTIKNGSTASNEIFELTGGRMASKVVYVTDSGLSADTTFKVAGQGAKVGMIGFGNANIKIPCSVAMQKKLNISFINDGFENTESSINLILNNAVKLDLFNIKSVKFNDIKKTFQDSVNKEDFDNMVLVNFD